MLEEVEDEKVKELMQVVKCSKNFACYHNGIEDFDGVKTTVEGKLLSAQCDDAKDCPNAVAFGYGFFCQCPLLQYLYKIRKK